MRFGIVGLGRMGASLALQAVEKGHEVVGYSKAIGPELEAGGVELVDSFEALAGALPRPRLAFVYVPHGPPTDEVLERLGAAFSDDDVVMDGGNSHWRDSIRHHGEFAVKRIRFLDVGTSGGVEGARHGACFMVGGDADAYEVARPLLQSLAVDEAGVVHAGAPGAGHFVKLIHNMIEFGMCQAIGEGVEMLLRSDYELDMARLFDNWNHGSVIRGWLVELMSRAFGEYGNGLERLEPFVEDTGEQAWGVAFALEREIPIPLIAQSVWGFYESRDPERQWAKSVAALRRGFGGHPVRLRDRPAG